MLNRRFFEMARAVADAVGDSEDVLEVAAGTGLLTAVVVPCAKRYVATDATPEMLELLRRRLDSVPNIEVRLADALRLDFADSSFDAVVIANLLHLLEDPTRALAEARRVLRAGGKLIVPTFSHDQGLLSKLVSRVLGLSGFPVVTRFRGRQLDMLVSESGFEVVEARWFGGLLPIRFVAARVKGVRL
jgi:ubiquinone/menaquinone biosynthesis C-methylase UbiE